MDGRPPRRRVGWLLGLLVVTALAAGCSGGSRSSFGPAGSTPSSVPAPAAQPQAAPTAEVVGHLPAPLSREVVLADGGALVVMGGLTATSTSTDRVYRLDLGTRATTAIGTLAVPAHDAAGATIGSRRFVFGGGEAHTIATVQALGGSGKASVVGQLPAPRSDVVAATAGGKTYLVGGFDGTHAQADVLETTDGVRFRTVARLAVAVRYPAVAALGNTLYVFGGEAAEGDSTAIQAVNVDAGSAEVVARLPGSLAHAAAAVLGGRVVVLGGRTAGKPTDQILSFDPAAGRASVVGRLPQPQRDAGIAVVADTAYLLGGEGPAPLATVVAVRLG